MMPVVQTRSIVGVAPVLPTDVREYSLALSEIGLLRDLICGAAYHPEALIGRILPWIDRLAGTNLVWRSGNRCVPDAIRSNLVSTFPQFEVLARLGLTSQSTDDVFAKLDRAAARRIRVGDALVIGREDCCLQTFLAARQRGAITVYDLPIAHYAEMRRAMLEEIELFTDAAIDFDPNVEYEPRRRARKDAELAAANHILVASRYVLNGLIRQGIQPERVTIIPYGCEVSNPFREYVDRKPIVLFVGQLGLRKGIPRLLRVWKKLGAHRTHTLRLIGKQFLQPSFLADYAGTYEHIPNMPRSELWKHYSAAQLFVFPSACDGFGLVLNEALSCGTPIIASSNTGAPGFITEGVEGVTYEHGDDDALATHLEQMLSNPKQTAEMGRAAYEFAQVNGWVRYRASIRELVERLLGKSCI